jgi:hypothetical protein
MPWQGKMSVGKLHILSVAVLVKPNNNYTLATRCINRRRSQFEHMATPPEAYVSHTCSDTAHILHLQGLNATD